MRRTTAGLALLLAVAVPAVVASPTSASPAPAVAAPVRDAVAASAPAAALPMLGPTPSSWEGGHAVAVAPRWWPRGYRYASAPWPSLWPKPVAFSPTRTGPLRGIVIALDPGHNIGNGAHVSLINRKYWVGLTKTCNTTGTATNAGYPEATFVFDVAARLRRLLTAAGATVVLTRDTNSRLDLRPVRRRSRGVPGAGARQAHGVAAR